MNDKQIDELINKALREDGELPEGLSGRLEQYIDNLAAKEQKQKSPLMRRQFIYLFGGVAAAILIGFVLFLQTDNFYRKPTTADTFSDPREAAIAANKALAFMSTQLNNGLDQVSDAEQEINKVNKIVNKQLNNNDNIQ
ncbi:MAG: hypothetical protein KA789_05725 [Parabacteroides sp.]|jgi:hypothetical protein|nr:hypothetical protein [Parabacteroides sp.]MBP8760096.1 hypothetical protein [Parabacteroides sp.]MBP9577982.1 hypothetical protein [Parabacteroides sp.]